MSRNLIWNLVKGKAKIRTHDNAQVIMLIDDDPDILLLFTEYLRSAGMVVDSFNDPEKALAHFTKSNPSRYGLIITDVRMRHLNGPSAIFQIQGSRSQCSDYICNRT